jgi:cell wall assembly regulator SMI1
MTNIKQELTMDDELTIVANILTKVIVKEVQHTIEEHDRELVKRIEKMYLKHDGSEDDWTQRAGYNVALEDIITMIKGEK